MRNQRRKHRVASPQTWLEYAEDDIEMAQRCLLQPALPSGAYYHAQQSGEKALKGYLVHLGLRRTPRTHDLFELAEAVMGREGIEPPQRPLEILDAFPTGLRYPEQVPPGVDEALQAIDAAQEIVAFVRQCIEGS